MTYVREASETANRIEYASRVRENSQLAINAADMYLRAMGVGDTPDTSLSHNELRHLLAPLGQYVAVIANTINMHEIMVGFVMGMARGDGDNSTDSSATIALVFSGTFFAQQCKILAQRPRGLNFLSASISSTFLALVRDMIDRVWREGVRDFNISKLNRTQDTLMNRVGWPMSPQMVQNAMGRLQDTSKPSLRVGSQAELETRTSCPKT